MLEVVLVYNEQVQTDQDEEHHERHERSHHEDVRTRNFIDELLKHIQLRVRSYEL